MAKKQQSKAQAKAASKSRPASSSSSAIAATSAAAPITAFSPVSHHFAILTQAIDRHRLAVYDTTEGGARLLVDYVLPIQRGSSPESAKCSALCWIPLPASGPADDDDDNDDEAAADPQAKRQKKKNSANSASQSQSSPRKQTSRTRPAIALGLQSGAVDIFDVAQGKITRVLSTAASSASSAASNAVTSLTVSYQKHSQEINLYATGKDGVIRSWDLQSVARAAESTVAAIQPHGVINTANAGTGVPNTLLALSPSARLLLAANHTISSFDVASGASSSKSTYTSHASPLTHLAWLDDGAHFVSAAHNDPVLYVWKAARSKVPVATIELEQGQEVLRLETKQNVLVVVGSQGYVGLYDIAGVVAETPKSTKLIKPTSTSTGGASAGIVDVRLSGAEAQRLDIARLIKSVKLDLTSTEVKDPATLSLLSTLAIPKSSTSGNLLSASSDDTTQTKGIADVQRYNDPATGSGRRTGTSQGVVGQDGILVDGSASAGLTEGEVNGLDQEAGGVEDERSLEERLRGMRVVKGRSNGKSRKSSNEDDDDDVDDLVADSDDEEDGDGGGADRYSRPSAPTTSLSLAASLSQALHSSDRALLSSLLSSSNTSLIKSTVLRVSGPNAVRLLEACVERLNGRKRGSQRARGMTEWIKWTLRLHAGYIMSLPGLTTRLANLHSSLSARLTAHDRLLALQGRLELVLSQIELRSEYDVVNATATGGLQGVKSRDAGANTTSSSSQAVSKSGKVWKEDEDDSSDDGEGAEGAADGMDVDEDDDEDEDADADSDSDIDNDISTGEEEEGEMEDIGLDSYTNGSGGGGGGGDESSHDDEEMPRASSSRRQGRAAAAVGDTSVVSGAATSDESDGGADEDDEDEEDEDEEDESELEDDEDDDEDEDDDDDSEGQGGFIDDEAEEGTEESDEDEDEE